MRLPKFDYTEPTSLEEACGILARTPSARILSGGTDLLVNMKHRVETLAILVNLKRIRGLDFVRGDKEGLRIGALAPLKKVATSAEVLKMAPALAKAAGAVGSYHHQVMGTIGGNICQQNRCKYFNQSRWWRSAREACFKAGGKLCHVVGQEGTCYSAYCGDVAPALLVLKAQALLQGPQVSRLIPLEDLYSGDGKAPLNLKRGEILSEFLIPGNGLGQSVSSYHKIANRGSIDFPILGFAFWGSRSDGEYRLAYTAVDRKPIRALKTEQELKGRKPEHIEWEQMKVFLSQDAKPVKTSLYSPAYKRELMGQVLKKTIQDLSRRNPS